MNNFIKYIGLWVLLQLIIPFLGNAQKNITHQQLVWYAYVNSLEFNSKISLVSEFHERRFINPDAQHQFAVRERLYFMLSNNWDLAVCFAYFLQSPNDPRSTSTLLIPELRPHIDLNNKQVLKNFIITHRYRIEDRFFRNTKNNELVAGYNSNWRFRYMLGIEIPLMKFKNEGGLKIKLGDEIFINAGKNIRYNTFDNNRIFMAVMYSPVKSLAFEAGYMNWFQQRSNGIDYYDRDIIRLSVTQKIKLHAK